MINIHELRLGNWVSSISCPGKYEQVEDIKTHNVNPNINRVDIADIIPIPLTIEMFMKTEFIDYTHHVTPHVVLKNIIFFQERNKWRLGFYKSCSIRYVHQLQNLYFLLTEEELCIKLSNNE